MREPAVGFVDFAETLGESRQQTSKIVDTVDRKGFLKPAEWAKAACGIGARTPAWAKVRRREPWR
jgi:hypothetical protein